jgi:hypothetical protein
MVKRQEADNQIVVDYEIGDRKLNDCGLPIPASKTRSRSSLAHPSGRRRCHLLFRQERAGREYQE